MTFIHADPKVGGRKMDINRGGKARRERCRGEEENGNKMI